MYIGKGRYLSYISFRLRTISTFDNACCWEKRTPCARKTCRQLLLICWDYEAELLLFIAFSLLGSFLGKYRFPSLLDAFGALKMRREVREREYL